MGSCSHTQVRQPPVYGFRAQSAIFNLGDSAEFEHRIEGITSDGQGRLLITYAKHDRRGGEIRGDFFRVSTNEGKTFGGERKGPGTVSFVPGGLATVYPVPASGGGSNLFYSRSSTDGASWSDPVQINDEQGSKQVGWGGNVGFVQPTESDVYCLWTDGRRGFVSTFFSASRDGGLTWTPNQAIEYDFREGEQTDPKLIVGEGGRLVAVWMDWRDRQTLVDIRCSYSDDGGQHWSASQKINDDGEHVWQIHPRVVSRGGHVYVVFADFREPGEEGDNDWNIYFARSDDNGQTWSKNVRLNDVKEGMDDWPSLTIDGRGILYCSWQSCRSSIFGEIVFAYSADGGRSWSPSVRVNDGDELILREVSRLTVTSDGRLVCLWNEVRATFSETKIAWVEQFPAPSAVAEPKANLVPVVTAPLTINEGPQLFADDFTEAAETRWDARNGTWMIVDGAYMGVEPGRERRFSSFARLDEPERYIIRGRFKLDPVKHVCAYLYFRSDPAGRQFYVVGNYFRLGAWLGAKEANSPAPVRSHPLLEGTALADRRFPFQNNRWYQFTLVVTSEQVDYYVNGLRLLSYSGRLKLAPDRIGIGGFGNSPTSFDDIVIDELRR